MDLFRDTGSTLAVEYTCPVSGLPVYSRPEWHDVYFDQDKCDYCITVRLIGQNILLSKVSGHSTKPRLERAFHFLDGIVEEHMAGRRFVFIDDVTDLISTTFEARKSYSTYLVAQKNIQAMVLFTPSLLLKLSFNLGRRLYKPPFKTVVLGSYAEVIHFACHEVMPETEEVLRPFPAEPKPMLGISASEAPRVPEGEGDGGLRHYAEEILGYLASIDWQDKGVDAGLFSKEIGHPFKAVFDAIVYIKIDMDDLFEKQRQIQGTLQEREEHIHALTQELIKAQEIERLRISRDLHDNVAQDLAFLMLSSETLFDGHPDIPPPIREKKEKFASVLKKTIIFIRNLAYDLRPPFLDQLGLVATLSRFCDDFAVAHQVDVDFYSGGVHALRFDFDTEINLYRLAQEALSNIGKHADARHITVRFTASHPTLLLRIEDDGKGFDVVSRKAAALKEKRMGLKSMEERVRLLSGTFAIRSTPGLGTRILVEIPTSGLR